MRRTLFLSGALCTLLSLSINAELLYTDSYMARSGIVMKPIATGIPNRVDGRRLLHWRGYVVRPAPLFFHGTELAEESENTLDQIRELIRQNRSRIRYVSIIGHSSSVEDEENRIELSGLAGFFQRVGGRDAMPKSEAVALVNTRLQEVYDALREAGLPASRIYNENRIDRQPFSTEATREGKALNNRVEVAFYATGPLHLSDLHVQFALDSDRILSHYDQRIQTFAQMLRRNPSLRVTIVGHTDRRGGYAYNMDLSKRRAEAVKRRLVELGISSSRIRTEGKGYTQPIARGSSEAAYRKNRRIEAKIYR